MCVPCSSSLAARRGTACHVSSTCPTGRVQRGARSRRSVAKRVHDVLDRQRCAVPSHVHYEPARGCSVCRQLRCRCEAPPTSVRWPERERAQLEFASRGCAARRRTVEALRAVRPLSTQCAKSAALDCCDLSGSQSRRILVIPDVGVNRPADSVPTTPVEGYATRIRNAAHEIHRDVAKERLARCIHRIELFLLR